MRSILLVAILTLDLVAAGHKGRHGRKKGVQKIKTRPTAERAGVIVSECDRERTRDVIELVADFEIKIL